MLVLAEFCTFLAERTLPHRQNLKKSPVNYWLSGIVRGEQFTANCLVRHLVCDFPET